MDFPLFEDMTRILLTFILVVVGVFAKNEKYNGHAIYQMTVENKLQMDILNQLANFYNLDVWSQATPKKPGIILIPKNMKDSMNDKFDNVGITYVVQTDNVTQLLNNEEQLLLKGSKMHYNGTIPVLQFDTFHRYSEVNDYLVQLAKAFPNVATCIIGGKSFEGRDIMYLRISTTNFQNASKPVIFIESLIHAREWTSLSVSLFAIEKLVIDVTDRDIIDEIDWIILPIANPDGYEYCHTHDRFWRKNRATTYGSCVGVDLNRNFDINWERESNNDACSEVFSGSSAFSEPESKVIGNIMRQYKERMAMFVNLHSFGSMILYPYGSGILPSHAPQINAVGVQMAQAIEAVKWSCNPQYRVGNSAQMLYRTTGTAEDYAQSIGLDNITISYTFELPGCLNASGNFGFMVDPAFNRQIGYETWEGLKIGARSVLMQYRNLQINSTSFHHHLNSFSRAAFSPLQLNSTAYHHNSNLSSSTARSPSHVNSTSYDYNLNSSSSALFSPLHVNSTLYHDNLNSTSSTSFSPHHINSISYHHNSNSSSPAHFNPLYLNSTSYHHNSNSLSINNIAPFNSLHVNSTSYHHRLNSSSSTPFSPLHENSTSDHSNSPSPFSPLFNEFIITRHSNSSSLSPHSPLFNEYINKYDDMNFNSTLYHHHSDSSPSTPFSPLFNELITRPSNSSSLSPFSLFHVNSTLYHHHSNSSPSPPFSPLFNGLIKTRHSNSSSLSPLSLFHVNSTIYNHHSNLSPSPFFSPLFNGLINTRPLNSSSSSFVSPQFNDYINNLHSNSSSSSPFSPLFNEYINTRPSNLSLSYPYSPLFNEYVNNYDDMNFNSTSYHYHSNLSSSAPFSPLFNGYINN